MNRIGRDLHGRISGDYLNFEDALTTNSASQPAQKVEVQGSGVTRKESEGISGSAAYFDGTSASSLKLPDAVNAARDDVTLMAWIKCDDDMFGGKNICSSRQGRDGAFSIWILI